LGRHGNVADHLSGRWQLQAQVDVGLFLWTQTRNSLALPIFQPLAASFFALTFPAWSTPSSAGGKSPVLLWGLCRLLRKDLCITIASVSMRYTSRQLPDTSCNSQSCTAVRRRALAGLRHCKHVASLELLSKYPVSSRAARENGGVLDLPVQPGKALVLATHCRQY